MFDLDRHRRRWRRYLALTVILIAGPLVIVCLFHTEVGLASYACKKCGVHRHWRFVRTFETDIIDRVKINHSGTDQLKLMQRSCEHSFSAIATQSGYVLGRGRPSRHVLDGGKVVGDGGNSPMGYYAGVATPPLFAVLVDLHLAEEHRMGPEYDNALCWFIQQSTGEAFGVTWDESHDVPVVPEGTLEHIRLWWSSGGKEEWAMREQKQLQAKN